MSKKLFINKNNGDSPIGGSIEIGERLVKNSIEPALKMMASKGASLVEMRAALALFVRAIIQKGDEIISDTRADRIYKVSQAEQRKFRIKS
jgi:hypothetical protein